LTILEFIIGQLGDALAVNVSGSVPHPMPDEFVTVEQTGSSTRNQITTTTLAVQSWSTSLAAAEALSARTKAAMTACEAMPEISRLTLESSYNYTDLATNRPRYQAVWSVVHYLGG